MALAILETDLKRESIAWLSRDERSWRGARRPSWPALAWFDAWTPILRSQTKVDFIGRLTAELRMRAMLVVPNKEGIELPV